MEEKFLPIGTVVQLKNEEKNAMITGYLVFSKDSKDKIYDYSGCAYPIGVKDDMTLGFNHDDIENVVYMGYVDEDQKRLNEFLKTSEAEIKKEIQNNM